MKFKCKMCGAPLDVKEGQTVVTCEFCQSKQTVANANDDRKENLFNRANSLRSACDFDKAILSYQSILTLFPNEPEAYWGICLCKYGVEYIDDAKTGKKIPTIHRASFNSILKDNDYLSAISYADVVAKEEYEEEAKQIANIQKNYLSISQKEEPFDIFICYKESDENGKRTPDSVMAQEIYSNLTDKGYKVFFARITLENKLGSMYEPYIFAALNSAKIMIVIGTKKEYFEATWVKNEWSRYIDLMRTKPDSYLIPCYKDMDAYEMPDEFLSLQAQDLSKLGFMQDLIRGIDKIMGKEETNNKHVESTIIQTDVNISALLKRAEILIGDDDFEKADNLLERVLDNDPVNSQAYLLKLLISFNFHSIEELKNLDKPLDTNNDYRKAYEFGDKNQKKLLENINEYIKNKIEAKKNDEIYNEAIDLFENEEYNEAFDKFNSISNYKDSNKKAEECIEKIYSEALDFKKENEFETAIKIFNGIINYKDSRKQIEECKNLKEEDDKERIYKQCILKKEVSTFLELTTMVAACKKLQSISGYKDADKLLVCYESLINDFREKQNKIKEEKIRIRKQKLKKIRKISIIFSSIACVVTFILLLTFLYLIPQNRQDNIQKLIDNRDYESALSLIEENNGYGDSSKLEKMCLAGKSFEDLDYDSGINYIYDIGGTIDVEFDSNGGTSEKQTQTIKKSKSLIENETRKDGYNFYGWKQENYSIDSKSHYAKVLLKAQYNVITYQIKYMLDGGTCEEELPKIYNTEQEIVLPNLTKTGYNFLGWSTFKDIEPKKDYVIKKGTIGNISIEANWEANKYNVTIDTDGGQIYRNKYTFTYDSNYYIYNPTKEGYTFSKFIYDDNIECNSSGVWKIAKDVTLKAIYTANTNTRYTVNYYLENLDGNGYTKKESEVCYGTSGAYVDVYCKTYDGFSKQNVSKQVYIKPNGTTSVDIYYTRNSYTLSFVCNGGDAIENRTLKYEEEIPNNIKPIREGYTFENWYADIEQTEFLKTMPAHNTNLYAYYSEETKVSHFDYSLNNTSATITKWKEDSAHEVVVPEYINNLPVTKIDDKAFLYCTAITKITLPASIEELGRSCFEGCISLIEIEGTSNLSIIKDSTFEDCRRLSIFPDLSNVTSIGDYAFENCASLTTIDISDSLTSIGSNAFKNCSLLLKTPDLRNVNIIGDNAFEGCLLLTDIEALDVSSSLGENVLKACKNIAKITMSFKDDIEEFYVSSLFGKKDGQYNNEDFYIVTLLNHTQYVVPNSLKQIEFDTNGKIPDYLCYGLTSITKVTDKSVSTTKIGKHAFDGCTNLIDFIIQNSTVSLIDEYAFQNCTSLTTMPEFHLEEVYRYAFANCNSLLVAPSLEDVNYIGSYAFSGCSLITSIKVTNATYIGLNSLYGCSSLTELEVPFVGTSIKSSEAFGVIFGTSSYDNSYSVTQLSKTYYIPNGLVRLTIGGNSIRENACVNLTSVTTMIVSDSVESIDEGAFSGLNSLESITLPFVGGSDDATAYTSVFGYIFGYTTYRDDDVYSTGFDSPKYDYVNEQIGSIDGLTWQYTCNTYYQYQRYYINSYYYYIPASLRNVTVTMDTTIPDAAFNGCSMLEKINIPLETDSIGAAAFQNCTSLKQFNSNQDGTFNIPETVTTINDYSFYSCSLVSNVSLSNSVLAIGKNTFAKCSLVDKFNSSEMTNLIIPEACQNIGEYAFKDMALITNVIVSDSVESIGKGAFNGFNSLESITLPFVGQFDGAVGVESVFGYIFGYYRGDSSKAQSGDYVAYHGFLNKQYGTISGAIWQFSNVYSVGSSGYYYHSYFYYVPQSLRNVTITVDSTIPDAAFNGCSMLEKINIPLETDSIGAAAFQNCTSLKQFNSNQDGTFNIPETVTTINDYSFYSCSLVSNVSLSNSVLAIGKNTFAKCSLVDKFNSSEMTNLIIPEACQNIGEYAFKDMALITNVIVSDSVESIGKGAFNGFNSLESITLPFVGQFDGAVGVESVFGYIFGYYRGDSSKAQSGDYVAYHGFLNKQYGTISGAIWQFSNVYSVGSSGYYYHSYFYYVPQSLRNVTITVDSTIPDAAFNGCTMLENVHLINCIDSIGDYAFQNCNAIVDYLISPSKGGVWDGKTVATSYHGGVGTQSDPYQIFSAKEFVYFLNQINNGETYEGVYFVLTSNINLGGFTINSTSLTEATMFKGILDGNSHKVFNFTINATDNTYNGLFGYMGGTIKNIGFEATMSITTSKNIDVYVGLVVGNLSGTLENVYVLGSLTSTSSRTSYVGGMVGYNKGIIINSYTNVKVVANSSNLMCYAAGLVGFNDGTLTGSFAYGNVTAKGYFESYSYASGLVAAEGTNSIVTSCFRYSEQAITKFGSSSTSYNKIGTVASLEDIISYCKVNWNGSVWSYKKTLPSF